MKINLQNIQRNIYLEVVEQTSVVKVALKTVIPCLVAGAIFRGLSREAVTQACDVVASTTSQCCSYATYGMVVLGAISFFKGLENHNKNLEKEKIKRIVMSEKDFISMNEEILRLSEELEKVKVLNIL